MFWANRFNINLFYLLLPQSEIQTMLNLGVPASKIVYANPCKQASHVRFAAQHSVALTTFDNEMELHKMKKLYPNAK